VRVLQCSTTFQTLETASVEGSESDSSLLCLVPKRRLVGKTPGGALQKRHLIGFYRKQAIRRNGRLFFTENHLMNFDRK
jgi:hypothetical protein